MKQKIGGILSTIGVIVLFLCPLFQLFYECATNIEGDGARVYGDNPVFKNVLGVKTLAHSKIDGEWEYSLTEISTPVWMQHIGLPKEVHYDFDSTTDDFGSTSKDVFLVVFFRVLIKILIPLIFLIPGALLAKK